MPSGRSFNPGGVFSAVWIPPVILQDPRLSPTAKLCYGRIANRCGHKEYCWPSQESLAQDLLVTVRTVQRSLDELEEAGHIGREQRGHKRTNQYRLLWSQKLEESTCIPEATEMSDHDTTEMSPHEATEMSCPIGTKPEELNQKEEESLFLPSKSDLNLEDDVLTFVANAYRRENRKAKLDNLRAKTSQRKVDQIREAEQRYGREDFRSALLAFLHTTSIWLEDEQWPLYNFLEHVDSYLPGASHNGNGAGKALPPAAIPPLPAVTHAEPAPSPPSGSNGHGLPLACQEWNRIVTAGLPVEEWTRRDAPLSAALNDPDFLEKLPRILERCQSILTAPESDAGWMTFRWLLKKDKSGVDNWYKILTGDLAWMGKKGGVRKSKAELALQQAMQNVKNRMSHGDQ